MVAVVAVAVVGGLFAAGVIKLNSSNNGNGVTAKFTVTFSETGLTLGGMWTVTLNGQSMSSGSSNIQFSMANGTYAYTVNATGYSALPASGNIRVSGSAVAQSVALTHLPTYSVTFTETGLASGTVWTATFAGVPKTSTTSTIIFTAVNGSYSFSVSAIGYSASPASGPVTVSGQAQTVSILFTRATSTYAVTFTETGLSTGTSWSVTLSGATLNSTSALIQFQVANGTYAFAAVAAGYTANPSSGTLSVSGAAVSRSIVFTSSGGGATPTVWSQAEGIAAAAAAGYGGGGWTPALGAAGATSTAVTVGISNFTSFTSSCNTTTWIGVMPSSVTIPATPASASSGASAFWLVVFGQSSSGKVLVSYVSGENATLLYTASGGDCTYITYVSTSGSIDSPAAVNDANAAGGSAFLSSHTVLERSFVLSGSYVPLYYGAWLIEYSTCSPTQSSGTGTSWNATVNPMTGQVSGVETQTTACEPPGHAGPGARYVVGSPPDGIAGYGMAGYALSVRETT